MQKPAFPSSRGAPAALLQGFVAYKEFLQDVDPPLEVETQAYIDNFVFGRDQVRHTNKGNSQHALSSSATIGLRKVAGDQTCGGFQY